MKKLETKDYKLVKVKDKQYVFLTGSQEVLEIQNPLLEEFAGGFGVGVIVGFVAVAALYYVVKNV